MSNIDKTLEEIIRRKTSDQPNMSDAQIFREMISTDRDEFAFGKQPIKRQIISVADQIYERCVNAQKTHNRNDFRAVVENKIRQFLSSQFESLKCPVDEARRLKKFIRDEIEKHTVGYGDAKTAYGCWLISPPPNHLIRIGPVCFEDKHSWLNRLYQHGEISETTHSRLSRTFSGERLEPRGTSRDQHYEETIRRQISNAPMVCEVMTHGLATELVYKRSMIAANLALTSISLIFKNPSIIREHFRTTLDGDPLFNYNFLIKPGSQKLVGWQWTRQHRAYHITPKMWEAAYENAGSFLKIAGEMISCWCSVVDYEEASLLLRSLSQSLFFFWKACREDNDLLSIIELVAALEALAKGQKKEGILKLIEARINLSRDQEFVKSKSLKNFIENVYSVARSGTLHGTNDKILLDWSETRETTEALARECLVACMEVSQNNWKGKDANFLLKPTVFKSTICS